MVVKILLFYLSVELECQSTGKLEFSYLYMKTNQITNSLVKHRELMNIFAKEILLTGSKCSISFWYRYLILSDISGHISAKISGICLHHRSHYTLKRFRCFIFGWPVSLWNWYSSEIWMRMKCLGEKRFQRKKIMIKFHLGPDP